MELQPQPLAAIEMIANEPIRVVQGRKAVCDGGTLPIMVFGVAALLNIQCL